MGKTNQKAGSEQKLSATIEDKDLKSAVEQMENALEKSLSDSASLRETIKSKDQEIEALKKVNAAGTTEAKADKSPAGSGMTDKDRTYKAEWGKGKDKKSGTFMLADTNKIYFEGKKLTAKEFMDNEEAQLALARNGSPLVKKVK